MSTVGHAILALVRFHHAGEGLQHRIHRRPVTRGTALAEARHGQVDESRVGGREFVPAEAEAGGDAGPEPLDEDVRLGGQRLHQLSALVRLQVDRQRTLAQVAGDREGGVVAVATPEDPRPVAVRGLHLDDFRALLGEQHRGVWSRDALAEIDDLDAGIGRFVAHFFLASASSVDGMAANRPTSILA
jgi:hypothetical protein